LEGQPVLVVEIHRHRVDDKFLMVDFLFYRKVLSTDHRTYVAHQLERIARWQHGSRPLDANQIVSTLEIERFLPEFYQAGSDG